MTFFLESDTLHPTDSMRDWEVIGMSKDSMVVKIEFVDPLQVSAGQKEDRLLITV